MGDVLSVVFGVIGVFGVVFTIYYGRKSAKLEREKRTITWSDIQVAADDLAEEIERSGFKPDLIFAPGSRGGIIAEFMAQHIEKTVPVLIGVTQWIDAGFGSCELSRFDKFETAKWRVLIPEAIYDNTIKKILVVDDLAMSGDAQDHIRKRLIERGFLSENIKTATVIASTIAIYGHKSPDYYWQKTDSSSFYFPWGKAR